MAPSLVSKAWMVGLAIQVIALFFLVLMSVGDESGRFGATLFYFQFVAIPQTLVNLAAIVMSIWYRVSPGEGVAPGYFAALFLAYLATVVIFHAGLAYQILG